MLDLSGVSGGGTLGKSKAEQERPYRAAVSGKDRAYKAGRLKLAWTEPRLSPELAEGFLRHYGLPTDYIDFTASSETAIQFAATRKSTHPTRRLAALEVKSLKSVESGSKIVDLRDHEWAVRPTRQYAFAFKPYSIHDLKDPAAAQFCQWFEFPAPEEDEPAACRSCQLTVTNSRAQRAPRLTIELTVD
jgi:hypothetical protein